MFYETETVTEKVKSQTKLRNYKTLDSRNHIDKTKTINRKVDIVNEFLVLWFQEDHPPSPYETDKYLNTLHKCCGGG